MCPGLNPWPLLILHAFHVNYIYSYDLHCHLCAGPFDPQLWCMALTVFRHQCILCMSPLASPIGLPRSLFIRLLVQFNSTHIHCICLAGIFCSCRGYWGSILFKWKVPLFNLQCSFLKLFLKFHLFFWLCWVFTAEHGLSLVAASGGYSLLQSARFSLRWLLLLQSMGSRRVGFSSCGMGAPEHRLSSCGAWA